MTKVAIIGAGNIGHSLGAFIGARPELHVDLWGPSWKHRRALRLEAFGAKGLYAIGAATAEPSLDHAVSGADIVILTVPTFLRHGILQKIKRPIASSSLLLAWEGTGPFLESLSTLDIRGPVIAGLQKSPIVCSIRRSGRSVLIRAVRTSVVAATTDPANRLIAKRLLESVLPFRFDLAASYLSVSVSPGNPLIHPARVYACRDLRFARGNVGFYSEWNDAASEVLLHLHTELAQLRDKLSLPRRHIRTLADRFAPGDVGEITREIVREDCLRGIRLPIRSTRRGFELDHTHRFFREDIGQGLSYIRSIAASVGMRLPTADAISDWYARINTA